MLSPDYYAGEDAGRTFARSLPPMPPEIRGAYAQFLDGENDAEAVCDWLDTFPETDGRYGLDDDFQDGYNTALWETLESLYSGAGV